MIQNKQTTAIESDLQSTLDDYASQGYTLVAAVNEGVGRVGSFTTTVYRLFFTKPK